MSAETRSVVVKLRAEANGFIVEFDKAGRASDRLAKNVDRSSSSVDKLIRRARNLALGAGLAKVATDAVRLEAAYSKTMAQIAVQTKAPQSELKELDRLALKMGADTVFSAQDAADAMLSLAKGGLTSAQIRAGALSDTLTLASAGGLELGDAADTVVQAMGAFRLRADQTNVAVAALAGSANASSADVSDMTQALSQAGTTANSAGLNIQETTAYLALFANQGFKGSDAGTSLRTMLSRLVPQTDQAKAAMARLGLTYTDANGNLVDATEIAKRTQDAFKGLNDQQRITAVNAIFGADAQRGVNAITAEGDEGLRKYLKSTNDLSQAQKLADAANSGTAGSLEQLKGSIETAEIQIGKGLAPVVQDLANDLNDLVSGGDVEAWARQGGAAVQDFVTEVTPLAKSLGQLTVQAFPAVRSAASTVVDVLEVAGDVVTPLVEAFNKLPDAAQQALILAGGAKVLSSRLDGIPGLANAAGGGLVLFGGNAKKGGDDAAKGAKGYSNLAGSLRSFGVLTAAGFVAPKALEDLQRISDQLTSKPVGGEGLLGSFTKSGKATADTISEIDAAFSKGDIGRYAEDLGIDLDKLSKSLAEGGSQGEYVQEVLAQFQDSFKSPGTLLGRSLLPFLDPDSEKATNLRDALADLADEYDTLSGKARQNGLAVDEAANGYNLLINGFGQYTEQLRGLPTEVVTKITTPGALKSKSDVVALARTYDLTPKQVSTIMKALDYTKPAIDAVLARLRKLPSSKTVTLTTIERTIKESYTKKGSTGGNNPAVDKAFGKDRGFTGMLVGPAFAGGGIVPGTPPQNPTEDNVVAYGSNTGRPLLVRSGEWIVNEKQSKKNDAWLRAMNNGLVLDDLFGAYASGGVASRYGRHHTPTTSTVHYARALGPHPPAYATSATAATVDDRSIDKLGVTLARGVTAGLSNARLVDEDGRSLRIIIKRG